MEKHEVINLFLDRDKAGLLQAKEALQSNNRFNDQSHVYKGYKDLNDWLTGKKMLQKTKTSSRVTKIFTDSGMLRASQNLQLPRAGVFITV
jgi:hypothetical protein